MNRTELQLEIRNALSLSDELSRHEHALGNDQLSGHLAALRTELDELERHVGGSSEAGALSSDSSLISAIGRARSTLRSRRDELPARLRPRMAKLVASVKGRVGLW
jgi:hypothetical protein